ncbi:MAG: hypothetical protein NZT92_06840 [Abditibacteriales bacterium]|nr:hypothetical protein [Abditibacteriales bacterium]MDW8365496.1 hypothetical protein [Abditibacteriales bacterium]
MEMQAVQPSSNWATKPHPQFFSHSPAVTIAEDFERRLPRPTHRFNLPPKPVDGNVRRRIAALKRCRLFNENDPVTVKRAETREELEAAYRLVHQCYVEAGYIDPHPSGMRVRIFEVLPETATFIAVENGSVIGTMSLIVDSPLGLPMEESYGEELNALRRRGRKIAEVSGLAVAKGSRNLGILVRLCRYTTLFAIGIGVEDLCIGVSPEHAPFFKEVHLFETMGEVRSYSSTKYDPVVALRLDLNTFPALCRAAYAGVDADANYYVFLYRPESVELPSNPRHFSPMNSTMLRYFLVEKTDVLRRADAHARKYLQDCYPHINFNAMLNGASQDSTIVRWTSPLQKIAPGQHEAHLPLASVWTQRAACPIGWETTTA